MNKQLSLKGAEKREEAHFGLMAHLGSASVIELMAFCGFDYVIVDTEKAPGVGVEEALQLVRAADASGIVPIVRVYENSPSVIGRALDTGARGLLVPHVSSRAEAEHAVHAAKFPLRGGRGMCPFVRGNSYDITGFAQIAERVNQESIVWLLVESPEAVANLADIASVPGVDGVCVGPGDLSQSLGLAGQLDHPRVKEAYREAVKVCREHGVTFISVLIFDSNHLEAFREQYEMGVRVFFWADVPLFIQAGREWLQAALRIRDDILARSASAGT